MSKAEDLPRINSAQFARLLNVSRAAVTHWIQDGMPHQRGGKTGKGIQIELIKALPWVLEQRAGAGKPGSARERVSEQQADRLALENARTRGTLVLAEQVDLVFQMAESGLAAQLDGLGGRMANELAGITEPALIRSRLRDECRRIRAAHADALSKLAQSAAPHSDGGPARKSAKKKKRKSVGGRKKKTARRKRGTRSVAK